MPVRFVFDACRTCKRADGRGVFSGTAVNCCFYSKMAISRVVRKLIKVRFPGNTFIDIWKKNTLAEGLKRAQIFKNVKSLNVINWLIFSWTEVLFFVFVFEKNNYNSKCVDLRITAYFVRILFLCYIESAGLSIQTKELFEQNLKFNNQPLLAPRKCWNMATIDGHFFIFWIYYQNNSI